MMRTVNVNQFRSNAEEKEVERIIQRLSLTVRRSAIPFCSYGYSEEWWWATRNETHRKRRMYSKEDLDKTIK